MDATIAAGLRGEAVRTVTEDLTSIALGSGDVPVLGTPAVLAMMEEAACAAVRDSMPAGSTSVGVWADLEHIAPSAVGTVVTATAELVRADARTLEFECESREGDTIVARARHRRVVVNRERFLGAL